MKNVALFLSLYVAALGVRISLLPFYCSLGMVGDEGFYYNNALMIYQGIPWDIFFRPPLWSYVLSLAFQFSDSVCFARSFTVVVGAFYPAILYFVVRLLFNNKVALIATLIAIFYPKLVFFSHFLWSETLYSVLLLIASFFYIKGHKHLDDMRSNVVHFYLAFLIIALASFTKEFSLGYASAFFILLPYKKLGISKCVTCFIIFLLPLLSYSTCATMRSDHIVILADAFTHNANAVSGDDFAEVYKRSAKENARRFFSRIKDLDLLSKRRIQRYWKNLSSFLSPSSYVVYRICKNGPFGTSVYDLPGNTGPALAAVIIALQRIILVLFGFGLAFSDNSFFDKLTFYNLLPYVIIPFIFFLVTRFQIGIMLFIITYAANFIFQLATNTLPRLRRTRLCFLGCYLALLLVITVSRFDSDFRDYCF